MKYFLDLPTATLESILRGTGVVEYEQTITSGEGDFLVEKGKVYRVVKNERPPYEEKVGDLVVRADPSREVRSLCWQIPVPHETIAESVRRYEVSPALKFVHRPSSYYFEGSSPFGMEKWLKKF